jgi:hypothetical protein
MAHLAVPFKGRQGARVEPKYIQILGIRFMYGLLGKALQ